MKVRLSSRAQRDLQAILEYLVGESPTAAFRIVDRLAQASLELVDRWRLYPILPRHPELGFRRRVVGAYSIYYAVEADVVQVVAILHSARDADRILFPED